MRDAIKILGTDIFRYKQINLPEAGNFYAECELVYTLVVYVVTMSILTDNNGRTFAAFSGAGCHLNLTLHIQHTLALNISVH